MIKNVSKEFMGSHIELNHFNYRDHVKRKGMLLFHLSNISSDYKIRKVGNRLLVGAMEYNLNHKTLGDVVDLLHEFDEDIEIALEADIESEALDSIPANFILDFNTEMFRVFDAVVSPIRKSSLYTHVDEMGNVFELLSYRAYKQFSRRGIPTREVDDEIDLLSTLTDTKVELRYRTVSLNVFISAEMPFSLWGKEGLSLFKDSI